jgi:hypothetical protein
LRFIEDLAIDRGSRILEILQDLEEEDVAEDFAGPDRGEEGNADEPPDSSHS